ncbi:hypothetical protein TWF103_010551 [Orbilia oligospora]|nr:hypothetical protein TWF103_010551 [Orbilia oligospora]
MHRTSIHHTSTPKSQISRNRPEPIENSLNSCNGRRAYQSKSSADAGRHFSHADRFQLDPWKYSKYLILLILRRVRREESHPTIDPISLQDSFVRLKLKTPSTGFTRCICTPDFFIYSSSHKDPNKTELFYLHLPIRQFQTRLDGPKARSYLTVLDSTNPHRVSTRLVVFTFVFSV